jgi:hypothetical protein
MHQLDEVCYQKKNTIDNNMIKDGDRSNKKKRHRSVKPICLSDSKNKNQKV